MTEYAKKPLAVVTMVYNENVMLPIWLKFYNKQVGKENCYVIDHGSTDGSTNNISAQCLKFPRSPIDESQRAVAVDRYCSALLFAYERVLFTDVDEIVVAEPGKASSLTEYVQKFGKHLPSIVSALGVDILHDHRREGSIDWDRPITSQRKLIRPFSALCKPTLVSEQAEWCAGFHFSGNVISNFIADLFLFHLAFCDSKFLLDRQARRNTIARAKPIDDHHSIPPEALLAHVQNYVENLPRSSVNLKTTDSRFEKIKMEFVRCLDEEQLVQLQELWELPRRFRGLF